MCPGFFTVVTLERTRARCCHREGNVEVRKEDARFELTENRATLQSIGVIASGGEEGPRVELGVETR